MPPHPLQQLQQQPGPSYSQQWQLQQQYAQQQPGSSMQSNRPQMVG